MLALRKTTNLLYIPPINNIFLIFKTIILKTHQNEIAMAVWKYIKRKLKTLILVNQNYILKDSKLTSICDLIVDRGAASNDFFGPCFSAQNVRVGFILLSL